MTKKIAKSVSIKKHASAVEHVEKTLLQLRQLNSALSAVPSTKKIQSILNKTTSIGELLFGLRESMKDLS
jgi:hypothetical protein